MSETQTFKGRVVNLAHPIREAWDYASPQQNALEFRQLFPKLGIQVSGASDNAHPKTGFEHVPIPDDLAKRFNLKLGDEIAVDATPIPNVRRPFDTDIPGGGVHGIRYMATACNIGGGN